MRHPYKSWSIIGVLGCFLLLGFSLSLSGQQPSGQNSDKVRELKELRDKIDRLIQELEATGKPPVEKPASPSVPPPAPPVRVPDKAAEKDQTNTITLYALPNGQLTQILLNDTPLGTGETGYTSLAKELQRLKLVKDPAVRVAAMPSVKETDLQAALGVTERGEYNPRDTGRSVKDGEVKPLSAARLKQPERDGKFVGEDRFRDHGGYIEDRWTGLLWQKDGTASGKKNFYEARDYAAVLVIDGIRGWRVPMREECATIFPATYAPFINTKYNPAQCCGGPVEFASYWTSELDMSRDDYAYIFQWYASGGANNCFASKNYAYVRCVHDPLASE